MTIASQTSAGESHRCPVCGAGAATKTSHPGSDSCCPACGQLLRWFRDRLARHGQCNNVQLHDSFSALGLSSLQWVEMVLDFEEEFQLDVPEEDVEHLQTVAGAIRYIRQRMDKAV